MDRLLDGRYRLGPLVGRGGMATVYSATDTRLRRAVAIKLFTSPPDEVALARLSAEARLLAGLSHPGLLQVFDVCIAAAQPYLVMQLVSGGTLRTLINRGPVAPQFVAHLGGRLADTLAYVHSRQIVHRDLKPSNVLLGDGTCYLADFGIAKALGSARLTATGHCVGTAAYLAPEQVEGAETGPAADIYSLGLVLLECLTGKPEYEGTTAEAAIARLTRSPRVPPSVPPGLRRALTAMTARDPRDRPDAAACAALLRGEQPDSVVLPEAATVAGEKPGQVPARPGGATLRTPTKLLVTTPAARWRPTRMALAAAVGATLVAGSLTLALAGGPVPERLSDPVPPPGRLDSAPVVSLTPQTAMTEMPATAATAQPATAQPQRGHGEPKPAKKKGGHSRG